MNSLHFHHCFCLGSKLFFLSALNELVREKWKMVPLFFPFRFLFSRWLNAKGKPSRVFGSYFSCLSRGHSLTLHFLPVPKIQCALKLSYKCCKAVFIFGTCCKQGRFWRSSLVAFAFSRVDGFLDKL